MENDLELRLKNAVIRNVRRKIDINEINRETDIISDLGCDSALIIQLVLDIENEFWIEFDDDRLGMEDITIYGVLRSYVEGKLSEKLKSAEVV